MVADTQAGDLDAARAGFEAQASAGFPAIDDQLWLTKVCVDAHVCSRVGDRERGRELLELLEPSSGLLPASPTVLLFSAAACAGMLAALLDEHDEADRHFAHAVTLTTAFRAPYLLASAQLEWGRALLRRADPQVDQARTLLANASATARSHGYGEIEREAMDLQASAGV
jgi:hypothetical protein